MFLLYTILIRRYKFYYRIIFQISSAKYKQEIRYIQQLIIGLQVTLFILVQQAEVPQSANIERIIVLSKRCTSGLLGILSIARISSNIVVQQQGLSILYKEESQTALVYIRILVLVPFKGVLGKPSIPLLKQINDVFIIQYIAVTQLLNLSQATQVE